MTLDMMEILEVVRGFLFKCEGSSLQTSRRALGTGNQRLLFYVEPFYCQNVSS